MRTLLRLAALAVATIAGTASATDVTTTFLVTATVTSACSVSGTTLAFGTYTGSQLDGTSTLTVTCTLLTPYTVKLNAGANAGTPGDVNTRRMTDGATHYLGYQLYSDALRTTVWDNTTGVSGSGTGLGLPYLVYGRIPAGENVPAGGYQDTITATLTY